MLLKNAVLLALIFLSLVFFSCEKVESYDKDAQIQLDIDSIQRYVTKNKINITKDASGVFYKMLRAGHSYKDSLVLDDTDTISVSYTGKMLNDSIVEQAVDSARLVVSGLPEGFRTGMRIIPKGSKYSVQPGGQIHIIVPSSMAYINRPVPVSFPVHIIPPNSNLDYTIQLLNIYKKK